ESKPIVEQEKETEKKEKPEKPKPHIQTKPKRQSSQKPKPKPKRSQPRKTLSYGKASVQVDGKNFNDDFYLNLIITKIANNWLNPLRGGGKMAAVIYFRIQKDGTITEVRIEKKSGNSLLDQSALRAVMASSPLPPLPESYTSDFIGVHFEFEHTGR
ncbi:MAG TPA: TonB C-terminal domain-containing protein, partial [Calditrichaeota bacterium]|nr:TonB C-terminal domain-containing protein [Calditrichota bacterium]